MTKFQTIIKNGRGNPRDDDLVFFHSYIKDLRYIFEKFESYINATHNFEITLQTRRTMHTYVCNATVYDAVNFRCIFITKASVNIRVYVK